MKKTAFLFFSLIIIFSSCDRNDKVVEEAENLQIDLKINRLEKQLFSFKSKEDARNFLQDNRKFVEHYLELPYPVADSQFVNIFYRFYTDPELKRFYDDANTEFGDFKTLEKDLEGMYKYLKFYYPSATVPEINTAFTGFKFDKDLVVTDSLVVISYDYFLGEGSKYSPPLYDYFLARYQKPYIVPMVALAVSSMYNNTSATDNSMLASMIYFGKAHYFVERLLPRLPDSLNIMYSGAELSDIEQNTNIIWEHFITNKLLFENERFKIEKYCGERPKVLEIGEKCPGRIGRWLGWQIVRKYMEENPDVTLQELMADTDAQKIFKMSKYKPK